MRSNPSFTFKGREVFGSAVVDKYASKTPGPGEYPLRDYPINQNYPEKYSIRHRPYEVPKKSLPAPGKILFQNRRI